MGERGKKKTSAKKPLTISYSAGLPYGDVLFFFLHMDRCPSVPHTTVLFSPFVHINTTRNKRRQQKGVSMQEWQKRQPRQTQYLCSVRLSNPKDPVLAIKIPYRLSRRHSFFFFFIEINNITWNERRQKREQVRKHTKGDSRETSISVFHVTRADVGDLIQGTQPSPYKSHTNDHGATAFSPSPTLTYHEMNEDKKEAIMQEWADR